MTDKPRYKLIYAGNGQWLCYHYSPDDTMKPKLVNMGLTKLDFEWLLTDKK